MMLLLKWSETLLGSGQIHLLEEIQAISVSSGLEKNNFLCTVDFCLKFCLYLSFAFLTLENCRKTFLCRNQPRLPSCGV